MAGPTSRLIGGTPRSRLLVQWQDHTTLGLFFGGREMLRVKNTLLFNIWRFPEIGVPQNQLLKKTIKMDDFGGTRI